MTLSPAEVAERFGVSIPTVLKWITTGELRAVNVSRSAKSKRPRWRITSEALAAFEAARTATPPPARTRRARRDGFTPMFYGP